MWVAKAKNREEKLRLVIIVLAVLVVLSLAALAVRMLWVRSRGAGSDTHVVPDNYIGQGSIRLPLSPGGVLAAPETDSHIIRLYQDRPEDNAPFAVNNMLPGDSYTQQFTVEVSHENPIDLYFNAIVTRQTKDLAHVLYIRAVHTDSGTVVYEGCFADMDVRGYAIALPQSAGETRAHYEITVWLPTWVGNDHQAAMLACDFQWYVADEGGLVPPPTGDGMNFALWAGLGALSLVALAALVVWARKEVRHG